jgi:putative transposase
LIIPKFKEGIAVTKHREIGGDILFATISKTATGKYYVSLVCETSHEAFPTTDSAVGIDTGIKDFAVLSSGTTYKNIKVLKSKLKKLKYQQKRLSKKRKGSHSRQKQRKIVAALHEKTANVRNDYLHKVSTEIIKNHDVICTETLMVKNMMKNHKLAQAFADVGLGTFYAMLEYKAKWNNRSFIKIDRFFPSSKTCNICRHIRQDLTLKDREWTCEKCNTIHDRDFNASRNILKQGLNLLGCGSGIGSQDKQKRAEALPLGKSMKLEAAPFRAR